ncbi:hypothetical protein [Roseiconus lacunae]|uniref:Tox-MPTase3 domain-containing protein n=1 Tax=Roseiconus lacunae TaxID=2605694 RepID=A0ABT7PTE2_9BACT|nr:hypothetical protein [Roseiconus lacunae]MDM4019549.1 hypothetical protein [Roseiconus lacunae]
MRLPVYLSPHTYLRTVDDEIVSASFFAPYDPTIEPYVRIATGDYPVLFASHGRDDALAMFLTSMAHELVHYRQWIDTGDITERGVAIRARNVVDKYALTTDHP